LLPAIAWAQRGDQAAFKQLYEQYARTVYNIVFRSVRHPQLAEDVCQEVWVKAFRELPKLADPQAFPAWLYRIAGRACVDAARRNRRLPQTAELPEDRLTSESNDPERTALRREQVRLTWEAMATMPARQHVALYLREIERMPYREIAQMLKTSDTAVEMLLFRARRAFAKAYEQLESATLDRCQHARRSMAAIIDGEATAVQQRAIRAHADGCRPCSGEMAQMRRTAAAYSALPALPVPALLGERIFDSIGALSAATATAGATSAPLSIAKVVGLVAANAKFATVALVATAATAAASVATVATPIEDEIRPGGSMETRTEQQTGSSAPHLSAAGVTGTTEGVSPVAELAPLPADPGLVPGTLTTVDGLTAPVLTTVDQTVADLTGSVDKIVHEVNAVTGALPTIAPIDTGILPPVQVPAVPALPTVPPIGTETLPVVPVLPLPTPPPGGLPLLP
jgi:RNA polymerase sigma-70 factor (ECF subfamily)